MLSLVAFMLTLAAAVISYLAAPRQQWLPQPWPPQPARTIALLLALAALASWLHQLQVSTALFTLLTLLMAAFIALPFTAVLRAIATASTTDARDDRSNR